MSRRLVIADIHGCHRTLRALLDKVGPNAGDTLYFLGDYIDRGPDSGAVLDILLELQLVCKVHLLRGNHEANFMAMFQECLDDVELFKRYVERINKAATLLDEQGYPKERYWRLLEATELYRMQPDVVLVHAGLDFSLADPFSNPRKLMEIREMHYDGNKIGQRKIIHGHVPTGLRAIEAALEHDAPLWPLDNGCVYAPWQTEEDEEVMGNLLCLDIDQKSLVVQPNVDPLVFGSQRAK